jgi:hypothetical protein
MTFALSFAELPTCTQAAMARKPKQAGVKCACSAPKSFLSNNYLAEGSSPAPRIPKLRH